MDFAAITLWFLLEKVILIAAIIGLSFFVAMYTTLAERKVAGWMQDRMGPNRAGPFGILQPLADGGKLFFKEEIIPVIFVPGSFSPNDDGMNDVFKVFHSENITVGTVTIYDRWGRKLAFLSALDQTWDGKGPDGEVQQGVYPFIVDYLNENNYPSQFVGDVTIIR